MLFYFCAAVIFAIYHILQGIQVTKDYSSGKYIEESVSIYRFEQIDCEPIDDLTFFSQGDNCRLIYNGDIDTIYMDCMYSYGLKEFVAYYNFSGDYTFDSENHLYPIQYDKYLMYDFPEGTKQIKMPFPHAKMYFNELIINCRDHTNKYNFTTSNLFSLAIFPTLIFLFIDIIISIIDKPNKTKKSTHH